VTLSGGQSLPAHCHRRATLNVVLAGEYREAFEDGEERGFGPATLIVKPAHTVHSNRLGRSGVSCLVVELADERLRWSDHADLLRGWRALHSPVAAAAAIRARLELRQEDAFTSLALEGHALEILADASRVSVGSGTGSRPRWLEQLREALHEKTPLGVSHLAADLGVHPAYMARVFRRHFGCTMGEYARRVRLQRAAHLLSATVQPISIVALATGFYDQSHFTRLFRRHHGMTPAAFRRAARGG
jgi:AraC family transcriptional regulator